MQCFCSRPRVSPPHMATSTQCSRPFMALQCKAKVEAIKVQPSIRNSLRCNRETCRLSRLTTRASPPAGGLVKKTAELSTALWLLSQLPANAVDSSVDFSKGSFSTGSYVVTLGLFLISLPGIVTLGLS